MRGQAKNGFIAALAAPLGDRADLLDAIVVECDARVVHPATRGSDATPDLAQGPVAKQIPVQVDLVVTGLRRMDPGVMLRRFCHGVQIRAGGGSFGEPAAIAATHGYGRVLISMIFSYS
jgi:hypothetical protein